MQRTLLIILVFTILVAIFALQNSAAVTIRLWFWSAETSLALVVILTFAAGALMGILFSIPGRRRKKKSQPASIPASSPEDEVPLEVNSQEDLQEKGGDPEFEDVIN